MAAPETIRCVHEFRLRWLVIKLLPRHAGCRWGIRNSLIHHPLRYKHHLLMSLAQLWVYLIYALPQQRAAVQLYQLQPWVQSACKAIDKTVLSMVPTVERGFGWLCDDEHTACSLVLTFCYVAIAPLFSINFTYWEVSSIGLLAAVALALAAVPTQ